MLSLTPAGGRLVPRVMARTRLGWADAVVAAFLLAVVYGVTRIGRGMVLPETHSMLQGVSLSVGSLPTDAGLSLLRMLVALVFSTIFAIGYGYLAARNRLAERLLIPLLDILQSVPVLGFLPIAVTAFAGLFPGSTLGLEFAALFAIFTAQAWNMAFSFYHSLTVLPRDLVEAASLYRLGTWQRFTQLELPAAMIPLVWNGMMSFGGSWFFLTASEAITVFHHSVYLPGIGSYLAVAVLRGQGGAIRDALVAMLVLIVLVDQVFWRPLVAWTDKFRLEQTVGIVQPTSFFLTLLRRSVLVGRLVTAVFLPFSAWLDRHLSAPPALEHRRPSPLSHAVGVGLIVALGLVTLRYTTLGVHLVVSVGTSGLERLFLDGLMTLARVVAAVLLGALWTVPAGVWIGSNPRVTRWVQPIALMAASYPANMVFPAVVGVYLAWHVPLSWGAVPLLMLGTQWYILFNVIAGAISLPTDLKEASRIFKLSGWERWRLFILPGIFMPLVTGGITAAGGAWNATILAELVRWGRTELVTPGLGSAIDQASGPASLLSAIVMMSLMVVLLNRLVWRRLYALGETKYHLE